jgi:DNA (cytosine-5)-methyltransferase 1
VKVLDLFSGIGGFSLGLERAGMETIAFCEIEDFPRQVLKKHWPNIPIAGDIRKLSYNRKTQELIYDGEVIYVGPIDLICGGYPCQPFSQIGRRKGAEDDRHLWPEYRRLIREIRPHWVVGENVIGHASMGLDEVLSDLENLHYTSQAFDIPAGAVGANHERRRIWIVAHADSEGLQGQPSPGISGWDTAVRHNWKSDRWMPAPRICRGGDGVSRKVDRLKGLGNAVVPQIPEIIGMAIMEIENG